MSNPTLGNVIETGAELEIDIVRLIETRALINANSGAGKSYAIRKLLEETHGKVLQIVLDMEGEFASLREKYDYILAGKGGDIPADPATAAMLAHKCLEMNFSLIVDLYELNADDRKEYVANFCDALVNAPKHLWHPTIVVIDEAHVFAPENGKAVSLGPVVDLLTRGRKRGFCAVLATQRLAKLHKDAAAECLNKLIGRTGLDIDLKRAGEELGMTTKTALMLRDLEPGEFYAFGPAFSKKVELIKIGKVQSRHPKAGQRIKETKPVATAKVLTVLSKLVDLPKEAEQELKDKESMMAKIKELERELKSKPKVSDEEVEALKKSLRVEYEKKVKEIGKNISQKVAAICAEAFDISVGNVALKNHAPALLRSSEPAIKRHKVAAVDIEGVKVGKCGREILKFLAMQPDKYFTKQQVGAMSGYAHTSGSFNNSVSELKKAGLVQQAHGGGLAIGDYEAVRVVIGDETVDTRRALESWLGRLGKCPKMIYQKLLEEPDREFSKEEIGEETGYEPTSGSFNNALSSLSTLGLVQKDGGVIMLHPQIASL